MRILHISKYYYPYLGGVENICKYLVEGMPEGYETAVLCFNDKCKDTVDTVNGHRVYRMATSPQYRDGSLPLQPFKDKVKVVPNAMDVKAFDVKVGDRERIAEVRQRYGNRRIVFSSAAIYSTRVCRI